MGILRDLDSISNNISHMNTLSHEKQMRKAKQEELELLRKQVEQQQMLLNQQQQVIPEVRNEEPRELTPAQKNIVRTKEDDDRLAKYMKQAENHRKAEEEKRKQAIATEQIESERGNWSYKLFEALIKVISPNKSNKK